MSDILSPFLDHAPELLKPVQTRQSVLDLSVNRFASLSILSLHSPQFLNVEMDALNQRI
jgi:hypothetical protein